MDYRALPVFSDAAAWWRPAVNLVEPGEDPVRVNTIEVSANLFEVLGVRPQVGAGFPINGPLFARNEPIAVISDRLWRSRYNADPLLVGRQLNLSGAPYTVVGIMPPKFHFPDDVDVWQRLQWDLTQHSRAAHFMESVLRLSDGVTVEQAQAATGALALRLQSDFSATNKGWGVRLVPLLDEQLGYYRPALIVLFGAVGLLLVIGCLNVASLLLTRALSREREIAVRIALGASPRQLVTQLLAESFVLSAAGAALGIATAALALPAIVRLTPVEIPRLEEASINLRALGLGLGVTAVTTIFFGLVPALLLLRRQLTTELRSGERGSSRGARRIYSVLVAGEVALACALLVSSALLVRTVRQMTETPTGVKGEDVLTTRVQLDSNAFRNWRAVADTHARILVGDSPAARGDCGWRWQLPAARSRLARSVSDRRAAAARTTRGRAAGAVPQRQRRLLRSVGRRDRAGPVVHDLRHRRLRAHRHRQRNVREAVSVGRTCAEPIRRDARGRNRTAWRQPDAAEPAAASGHALRGRRRRA